MTDAIRRPAREVFQMRNYRNDWEGIAAKASFAFSPIESRTVQDLTYVQALMVLAADADRFFRKSLWLTAEEVESTLRKAPPEVVKTLSGKSPYGFNLGLIATSDARGAQAHFSLLEDVATAKMIMTGPQRLPDPILAKFDQVGISYVQNRIPAITRAYVNGFVKDAVRTRLEAGLATDGAVDKVNANLVQAFAWLMNDETLKRAGTLGNAIASAKKSPHAFVRVVKPKTVAI